jgi:hypothetical protein
VVLQQNLDFKALAKRRELLVGVAVVVLAAAVVYFYLGVGKAKDELADLRSQAQRSQESIPQLTQERDALSEKEASLIVQVTPATETPQEIVTKLPTRADAIRAGTELTEYITERQIAVNLFNSEQAAETVAGQEHPAVGYSIALRGEASDLLGALDLVEQTPSSVIKGLSLTRDQAAAKLWVMGLSFTIPYE